MIKVILAALVFSFHVKGSVCSVASSPSEVRNCVSGQDALTHMKILQYIADTNNNTRAAGTIGHDLSANYVAQQLQAAGYAVQLLPFNFDKFVKNGPATFELLSPTQVVYVDEKDFNAMTYSPSGDISNTPMTAVDVLLGAENKSTSGCEVSDFADFPKGNIALIQRGTCPFSLKAQNAEAAGASGAIIFNQGDSESRKDLFQGTLTAEAKIGIPVFAVSYPLAVGLMEMTAPTFKMMVSTTTVNKLSHNVIAETTTGNPDNVVMIGAHLDSVDAGPGINDNGSGSAAILEVALKFKNVKTNNRLRFAWWSAEELGLVGSTKYVQSLSKSELSKLALYLNFDMVASPNYILGVYDGDGSKNPTSGPAGSGAIESLFHLFFSMNGPLSVEVPLNGRSDYGAFATAGIPVGGTFTGAEGTKTQEEANLYGGDVGKAYDACYHQACDTIQNLNMTALEANVDAIAFSALTYAYSTASVVKKALSQPMATKMGSKTNVDLPLFSSKAMGCQAEHDSHEVY